MIDLARAIDIAKEYLECTEIEIVLDAPGYWIIYKKTDEIEIGGYGALIKKDTGAVKPFILPSEENFEILDKAVEINL